MDSAKTLDAETKLWNFTVGGIWLYAMVGTEGQRHWTHVEFTAIDDGRSFSSIGMFSDEKGSTPAGAPRSYRVTTFSAIEGNRTKVDSLMHFDEEATIKMFVERGFKEGTTASLNQLDELLAGE